MCASIFGCHFEFACRADLSVWLSHCLLTCFPPVDFHFESSCLIVLIQFCTYAHPRLFIIVFLDYVVYTIRNDYLGYRRNQPVTYSQWWKCCALFYDVCKLTWPLLFASRRSYVLTVWPQEPEQVHSCLVTCVIMVFQHGSIFMYLCLTFIIL